MNFIKRLKKTGAFVAVLMLISGVLLGMGITADAALLTENEFAQRIDELKREYPDGMYWTKTNGTDADGISKAGPNRCTNHYAASGTCGEYAGVGWQCFGFANVIAMKVFGTYATKFSDAQYVGSGWTYNRSVSNYCAGDYIRLYGTFQGHSVFVTKVEGNKITIADCNRSDLCQIDWDMVYDKSYLDNNAAYVLRYSGNTLTGNGTLLPTLAVKYNANGGIITPSMQYKVSTEGDYLNVRREPTTATDIITSLPDGTEMTVLETKEAGGYLWGKINTAAGTGWCAIYDYGRNESNAVYNGYFIEGGTIKKGENDFVQTMEYGGAKRYAVMDINSFGLAREGYNFLGWSTEANEPAVYDELQSVCADEMLPNGDGGNKTLTLYAVWQAQKPTLEIYELPYKTLYMEGEAFETAGLKIRLVYDNGDTSVLDSGFTVTGYDPSVIGKQRLTLTYEDLTANFEVEVKAYDGKAVLDSKKVVHGERFDLFLAFDKAVTARSVGVSKVTFDSSKLELIGGGWLTDSAVIENWNINDNAGVVSYENDVVFEGAFLRLTFKAVEEGFTGYTEIGCIVTATKKDKGNEDIRLYIEKAVGRVTVSDEVMGDADGNGVLNGDDAIYVLYHVLFGAEDYPVNVEADYDGNGLLNGDDAIYLLYHVLFGGEDYPLK